MRADRPRSGKTTLHRDGSVTLWNIYENRWERHETPPWRLLVTLGDDEKKRVMRHMGVWRDSFDG